MAVNLVEYSDEMTVEWSVYPSVDWMAERMDDCWVDQSAENSAVRSVA